MPVPDNILSFATAHRAVNDRLPPVLVLAGADELLSANASPSASMALERSFADLRHPADGRGARVPASALDEARTLIGGGASLANSRVGSTPMRVGRPPTRQAIRLTLLHEVERLRDIAFDYGMRTAAAVDVLGRVADFIGPPVSLNVVSHGYEPRAMLDNLVRRAEVLVGGTHPYVDPSQSVAARYLAAARRPPTGGAPAADVPQLLAAGDEGSLRAAAALTKAAQRTATEDVRRLGVLAAWGAPGPVVARGRIDVGAGMPAPVAPTTSPVRMRQPLDVGVR